MTKSNFFLKSFFVFSYVISVSAFSSTAKQVIHLTPGKSGTHWTSYALFYLTKNYDTKLPLIFKTYENADDVSQREQIQEKINWGHFANSFHSRNNILYNINKDLLIVNVRNYKELFIRHCYDHDLVRKGLDGFCIEENQDWGKIFEKIEILPEMYYNLCLFDSWPEERRHMIIYEDLITDPELTFTALTQFLGEDLSSVSAFMENYDQHKHICLEAYNPVQGAVSKGSDPLFHSKRVPKKILKEIDLLIAERWGKIWEKYLSHYAEDGN